MMAKDEKNQKVVETSEWYDFVGQLADILPVIHPGGRSATQELLEMCGLTATSRVLDVGCGSGSTACLIASDYGSQVHGVDISKVMITQARERAQRQGLTDQLEFRVANIFDLPFENDFFDVVIVESVLLALEGDIKQALKELMRVVRPGGKIAVNEGTIDQECPQEFLALLEKHPAFHGYITSENLRGLFEESGLEVIETRESKEVNVPKPHIGLKNLLSFMIRIYPKLLLRLVRDKQIRKAQKIDEEITKTGKEYMGYVILVGQKSR